MAVIAPAERPRKPPLFWEFDDEEEDEGEEGLEYYVREVTTDLEGITDVATPCAVIANCVSNC
jgi:hypothetical protein